MSEKKRLVVADNVVVTMDFVLKVDSQVVEDTAESDAIQFLQGVGQVLPALEGQLYDMAVGDRKEIVLSATEGYGEIDDDAISDIPLSDFPKDIPLKKGTELQLKDQDGEVQYARIEA